MTLDTQPRLTSVAIGVRIALHQWASRTHTLRARPGPDTDPNAAVAK